MSSPQYSQIPPITLLSPSILKSTQLFLALLPMTTIEAHNLEALRSMNLYVTVIPFWAHSHSNSVKMAPYTQ